jgi:two-component system, cell cycle sensor histidine kinase and response regulator CckA
MDAAPTQRLRILVATADRMVACDLRGTLERLGQVVSGPSVSAEAALKLAEKHRPDVALVDLRLDGEPDAAGLAALLREKWGVPVVFVAAHAADSLFERAMAAKPAGYLKRPHGDAELSACLAAAISRAPIRSAAGKSPAHSGNPAARGPALARAAELSRKPSFRELLGPRAASFANGDEGEAALGDDSSFFDEVGQASVGRGDAVDREPEDEPVSPLDVIGDPVLVIDPDWRITGANARALVTFGGASPLIGRDLWAGFPPGSRERYAEDFLRALETEEGRHHFEFQEGSGHRWFDVSVYRSPVAGEEGLGLMALFRDITARKRSEAEKIRLHRLEGLGLLARGFAHDFNNLLTVLVGSLDLAAEYHPEDEAFTEEIAHASRAAESASDLVQQLLTFAQGGEPIREETRLSDLIRGILNERRHASPGIRYQFQSGDAGLTADVDRRQIARLIENLVTNAEQAMPEGGVLIARCQRLSGPEASRLRDAPVPLADDQVVIEVIDTGRGMSEEELEHAFDPYFTTRKGANATGIGLTVCESIAKAHDGFILLQSKEGRGTIATFCLPLGRPAVEPVEMPGNVFMPRLVEAAGEKAAVAESPPGIGKSAPEPVQETGRILILEDDELIRRLIAVTLRRDGHEVVETADGHDTIRLYREAMEAGRAFDLVLSDLTIIHGLGGVETIRALREMDPGVLAVVSSGYSDAPAMARPEAFGFSAVLPKPYPPRELRGLVGEMLRRSRSRRSAFPA